MSVRLARFGPSLRPAEWGRLSTSLLLQTMCFGCTGSESSSFLRFYVGFSSKLAQGNTQPTNSGEKPAEIAICNPGHTLCSPSTSVCPASSELCCWLGSLFEKGRPLLRLMIFLSPSLSQSMSVFVCMGVQPSPFLNMTSLVSPGKCALDDDQAYGLCAAG